VLLFCEIHRQLTATNGRGHENNASGICRDSEASPYITLGQKAISTARKRALVAFLKIEATGRPLYQAQELLGCIIYFKIQIRTLAGLSFSSQTLSSSAVGRLQLLAYC
jgi:hypothetical protein